LQLECTSLILENALVQVCILLLAVEHDGIVLVPNNLEILVWREVLSSSIELLCKLLVTNAQ
jgi:hypothetical protein